MARTGTTNGDADADVHADVHVHVDIGRGRSLQQTLVEQKLTYWLMRTMATSSRSVKRLKASSMACDGVSSASASGDRDWIGVKRKRGG